MTITFIRPRRRSGRSTLFALADLAAALGVVAVLAALASSFLHL